MKSAVPLLLLTACTHTREPALPDPKPIDASANAADADVPETVVEPAADAADPPRACADAGLAAWYVLTTGDACERSSTLEWLEPDGSLHGVSAPGDPLLAELRWIAQLPTSCLPPGAAITEVRRVRRTATGDEFHIELEAHDLGGMTCHAMTFWNVVGRVAVDDAGAIVSADFHTSRTVAVASSLPACRALSTEARESIRVRRSCSP